MSQPGKVVCQSDEVMMDKLLEETFGALEQDGMELVCIHTAFSGEVHGGHWIGYAGMCKNHVRMTESHLK